MKIRIQNNGHEKHSDLLKRVIEERIPYEVADDGMLIELCVDKAIGKEESFVIEKGNNGWKITGADERGLYYGIGKFLHTAKWSEENFVPNPPVGVSTPANDFRAVYTSVHFYNWYHEAPTEELKKYLEEMLLWGHNIIFSIVPLVCFNSCDEPDFFEAVEKNRALFKLAKELGMKVGLIINPNQGLKTTPAEFAADKSCYDHRGGAGGKNICPSIVGAMEYMRYLWVMQLKRFTDIGLDYVMTWPYDEGGCGCENCRPWGAKAFCDLSTETFKVVKRFYPDAKLILSTWYMDEPIDEGEYEGLWKRLGGDMSYIDYLMVDAHGAFPKYPLEHEVIKPMVNFPEISMWGLRPWGGRGANPLPKRFQEIWDSSKHLLSGGMPYSEGMYEDISKIQCVSYYWSPDRHYRDILGEYINYEYSADVINEVLELMELIEVNHVRVKEGEEPDMEACYMAEKIARDVNERLSERVKKTWRWRILFIRAVLDKVVNQYHVDHDNGLSVKNVEMAREISVDGVKAVVSGPEKANYELWHTREWYLEESEEAMAMAEELCELYHTNRELGHSATYPPVQGRQAVLNARKTLKY